MLYATVCRIHINMLNTTAGKCSYGKRVVCICMYSARCVVHVDEVCNHSPKATIATFLGDICV